MNTTTDPTKDLQAFADYIEDGDQPYLSSCTAISFPESCLRPQNHDDQSKRACTSSEFIERRPAQHVSRLEFLPPDILRKLFQALLVTQRVNLALTSKYLARVATSTGILTFNLRNLTLEDREAIITDGVINTWDLDQSDTVFYQTPWRFGYNHRKRTHELEYLFGRFGYTQFKIIHGASFTLVCRFCDEKLKGDFLLGQDTPFRQRLHDHSFSHIVQDYGGYIFTNGMYVLMEASVREKIRLQNLAWVSCLQTRAGST